MSKGTGKPTGNAELRDLGTHMAGAVNLHETRKREATMEQGPAPGQIPDKDRA